MSMNELSVNGASRSLGLSEQRVRALLKAGRIKGHKLGSVWIVEGGAQLAVPRPDGRPLGASNAWALLALLSGEDPRWVDPSVRSRLRRWISQRDIVRLLREGEPRSEVHRLRVLPGDLSKIEDLYPVVRSGLFVPDSPLDIVPIRSVFDAYVNDEVLAAVKRRFRPEVASNSPNLFFRLPLQPWVLSFDAAPPPVVAADLLNHDDPRVSGAAVDFLEGLSGG